VSETSEWPEPDGDPDAFVDQLIAAGYTYAHDDEGRITGLANGNSAGHEDGGDPDGDGEAAGEADPVVGDVRTDDGGGDGGGDGDTGAGGGDDRSVPVGSPDPGGIHLKGTPLSDIEADGLLGIRQMLIDHPELVPQFNALVEQKITGAPAATDREPSGDDTAPGAPGALPDEIDPHNPTEVFLWRQLEQLRGEQSTTADRVEDGVRNAEMARIRSETDQAVALFRDRYPQLTDDDIGAIRSVTSREVNIASVMARYPGQPAEGIASALKMGSMALDGIRDKVLGIDTTAARQREDQQRQSRLSSLSGSGGATSRRPAPPKKPGNWNEVAAALATAISEESG
jgi:hypothetical protein